MIKIVYNILHGLVDKLQQSESIADVYANDYTALVKCVCVAPYFVTGLIYRHYDLGLLCSYSICENRIPLKATEFGA